MIDDPKKIPTITFFEFNDGTKALGECSKEELLYVIDWLSKELHLERAKRARDFAYLKGDIR